MMIIQCLQPFVKATYATLLYRCCCCCCYCSNGMNVRKKIISHMVLIASHCIGVKIEVLLLMLTCTMVCYLHFIPTIICWSCCKKKSSKIGLCRHRGFCPFFRVFCLLLHICSLYLPTIYFPFSSVFTFTILFLWLQ